MNTKTMIASVLLAMLTVSANAASVSLVYRGDSDIDDDGAIIAGTGTTLTFDLVMDFTDRPTLGGGFDINWDSSVFAFESYADAGLGDPQFGRDPVLEDGRLFDGLVAHPNGLTQGTIATLVFTVIASPGVAESSIASSATQGDHGAWIDLSDFTTFIVPDYNGVVVRVVPVPAALWLTLSGLGVLVGFGRRKKA